MTKRRRRPSGGVRPAHQTVDDGPRRRLRARLGLPLGALVTAALVTAALVWFPRPPPLGVSGPIVLVSIDTLRADRLPAYGYAGVATPAIDRLVADAVLFERAYSHSPQTLPAHVSMFTGLLPVEHGVRDNLGFAVGPERTLLPELLAPLGYRSAAVVSSYVLRKEVGLARGFDTYDDRLPAASPDLSSAQVQRDGGESLQVAERWLDGNAGPDSRFFLFLHLYEPHAPYAPPARFGRYEPYDGEIAYADEIVGGLFDALRARGLYDDALIVLLSDHGEGLGDHGEQEHGVFLYDEAIRVPLVVKLPGGREAGRRVSVPVQHIDLLPTLLDLLGEPVPGGLRGRSLRPLLAGDGAGWPRRGLYAEAMYPRYHFGWSELYALTTDRYRYIRAPREELYDLVADGDERENLAPQRARTVRELRETLGGLVGDGAVAAPAAVSDAVLARLRSLGYLGGGGAVDTETPAAALKDPKDGIGVLARYREAVDLAGRLEFDAAVARLEEILADNPEMADVWLQLGNLQARTGRLTAAVESYRRAVGLNPADSVALRAVASTHLRLRQWDAAWENGLLAADVARTPDHRARAHELLARIALVRDDRDAARRQAELARDADPTLPLPDFVRARILHEDGRYAEALPVLEGTLEAVRSRTLAMPELHFYLGDTLARLDRPAEAATHFREELRLAPHDLRTRASLAMLHQSQGEFDAAARTIGELLEAAPTPDGYRLAAQLWEMFGAHGRAADVRAEAARLFGGARRRR